jgi:hypothetical protein
MGHQLMVTTVLTIPRPRPSRWVGATLTVAGLTGAGIALGAIDPGLAGNTHPHPALIGTPGEASSIFINNLRVLAAPFALWALGFSSARHTRQLGDLLVFGLAALNTLEVGIELGRWGFELVPYVPQLPLEWAALVAALFAWLTARNQNPPRRHMLLLAAAVIALLAGAAIVETWCVPHLRSDRTRVETPARSRLSGAAVSHHPEFASTQALPLKGRLRLPSPHKRSVPLGHVVVADRAHINHRPLTGGITWTSTPSPWSAI